MDRLPGSFDNSSDAANLRSCATTAAIVIVMAELKVILDHRGGCLRPQLLKLALHRGWCLLWFENVSGGENCTLGGYTCG